MHSSVFSSLAAASIAFTLTACEFQSTSGGSPDGGASTDAAGPAGLSEADMAPLGRMVLDDGAGADGLAKLTGNGPVLFRSDLEDQNSSCWGSRSSSGYARTACGEWGSIGSWNSKLTDGGVRRSGSKAMSFTFSKNEEVAGASLLLSANVVNVRAYYNFAPGYDFGQGVKIGRVSSFNEATQMNDIDVIMTVRSSGSVNQCGVTNMKDMGLFFNGRPVGFDWGNISSTRTFERGRWYAIEYQVFLNTPGVRNGWVKLWVDGVQVASKTGLNLRGNGGYNVKLNRVRVGGWYSNSAKSNSCPNPSQPSTMHVDDVAVGTAYIGPN